MVPSLRYGYSQKNNADIQLVIDALEVAYKNDLIDSFCIVSGDSDYTPEGCAAHDEEEPSKYQRREHGRGGAEQAALFHF